MEESTSSSLVFSLSLSMYEEREEEEWEDERGELVEGGEGGVKNLFLFLFLLTGGV